MERVSDKAIVKALLERHGRTFAEELDIDVECNQPQPLFRLLCAALLFSARIRSHTAAAAAQALAQRGWTTPKKMLSSSWAERARVLNSSGYARYDERTATMLGETSRLLLDRYNGDLRNLREAAGHDPAKERKLLKEFKGIGDAGADIFLREVQAAWDELFPFLDKRALEGAAKLHLQADAATLSQLVDRRDFPRLAAALVRIRLENNATQILDQASKAAPDLVLSAGQ